MSYGLIPVESPYDKATQAMGMATNTMGKTAGGSKTEITPADKTAGGALLSAGSGAAAGVGVGASIAAGTQTGATAGGWYGAAIGAVVGALAYYLS